VEPNAYMAFYWYRKCNNIPENLLRIFNISNSQDLQK
jgi:hypothetical protein